jgi:hypothetical protein
MPLVITQKKVRSSVPLDPAKKKGSGNQRGVLLKKRAEQLDGENVTIEELVQYCEQKFPGKGAAHAASRLQTQLTTDNANNIRKTFDALTQVNGPDAFFDKAQAQVYADPTIADRFKAVGYDPARIREELIMPVAREMAANGQGTDYMSQVECYTDDEPKGGAEIDAETDGQ